MFLERFYFLSGLKVGKVKLWEMQYGKDIANHINVLCDVVKFIFCHYINGGGVALVSSSLACPLT